MFTIHLDEVITHLYIILFMCVIVKVSDSVTLVHDVYQQLMISVHNSLFLYRIRGIGHHIQFHAHHQQWLLCAVLCETDCAEGGYPKGR